MKVRILAIAGALLFAGLFVAGSYVPPYGGGAGQVMAAPASVPAPASHGRPPVSPKAGQGLLYGTLRDAAGRPLPGGRVAARVLDSQSGSMGISYFARCDAHGQYYMYLRPGDYAVEFAGGPLRWDVGQTHLDLLTVAVGDLLPRDYRLAGDSALVTEVQLDRMGGVLIHAELLDAEGSLRALGEATSGTTLLRRGASLFTKAVDLQAVAGRGLCFEGLSAGDYRLRLYLNREQGLSFDVPVRLEPGEVLDLGRLRTTVSDYTRSIEGSLNDLGR